MKNKASSVMKHIISYLSSIGSKAKADAMKACLVVLSLLKSESKPSLMASVAHKFHALLDRKTERDEVESRAIVLHNASSSLSHNASFSYGYGDDDDDDGKLPDLNHSYFGDVGDEDDDDQDLQNADGSVIDQVKNPKEHQGQDFVLENEIDQVADLFIKRFQKQIRLQKLESFKRFQQMLERSV